MKKVHNDKIEIIEYAFNKIRWMTRETNDVRGYFEVYNSGKFDNKARFEINWASVGTVNPTKTLEFAEELRKTAEMLQVINGLKLETYRTDEPYIPTKEEYEKECAKVLLMVFNYETGNLIAWLLK